MKHLLKIATLALLGLFYVTGLTGTAQAGAIGPIGTYYLTTYDPTVPSNATLDAIQGSTLVQNTAAFPNQEGPIAVFANLGVVRTTGWLYGYQGTEYTGIPSQTVTADGTVYTDVLFGEVYDYFKDGTTDGNTNYVVGQGSATVIATDTSWGGTGTVIFSLPTSGYEGITYDATNNSLWVQNLYTGVITDYTMTGSFITSFATVSGIDGDGYLATALAMDVDHTLWYEDYGTGTIEHYATNGTYLGSAYYAGARPCPWR